MSNQRGEMAVFNKGNLIIDGVVPVDLSLYVIHTFADALPYFGLSRSIIIARLRDCSQNMECTWK